MSAFVRTAASSLRAATSRNVARQGAYIQRRGYADAPNDTLKLSLVLPHQVPVSSSIPDTDTHILAVYLCLCKRGTG